MTFNRGDYMYRFLEINGNQVVSFDFFNSIALYASVISALFFIKLKLNSMGVFSKYAIHYASRANLNFGKIVKVILASIELILMVGIGAAATLNNNPFGEMVGTGVNYFGGLFSFPIYLFIASCVLMTNPLKQIDITTLSLPIYLFFVKIACFLNGCCWGIPWENGPYNYHYDHPGNQVPVQAIEAFWALAIFVFLLIYRKKAKPGTLLPMYMILYSATRFCSEFFRREENVLWIFKTYHLLCIAGVIVGIILLLIVKRYGERISDFFDGLYKNLKLKIAQKKEEKIRKLAEEKAKAEAAEIERLEKVRRARERAKARKK